MEEGDTGEKLDVEVLAGTLLPSLDVDLYLYRRRELGMERGRILAAIRGLLLHGLQREGLST